MKMNVFEEKLSILLDKHTGLQADNERLKEARDEYHDQYHLCEAKLLSHKSLIKQGEEAYRRMKKRQLTQSQTKYLVKFLKLRLMNKPNQAIEEILKTLKGK